MGSYEDLVKSEIEFSSLVSDIKEVSDEGNAIKVSLTLINPEIYKIMTSLLNNKVKIALNIQGNPFNLLATFSLEKFNLISAFHYLYIVLLMYYLFIYN